MLDTRYVGQTAPSIQLQPLAASFGSVQEPQLFASALSVSVLFCSSLESPVSPSPSQSQRLDFNLLKRTIFNFLRFFSLSLEYCFLEISKLFKTSWKLCQFFRYASIKKNGLEEELLWVIEAGLDLQVLSRFGKVWKGEVVIDIWRIEPNGSKTYSGRVS